MKVTLAAGIKSLSGSVKQKNGSRIIFKTFTKPSVNRKSDTETRMYIMPPQKRTSPVSEKELKHRARFAQAADLVARIPEDEKKRIAEEWRKNKYMYNGKKYKSFRGFLLAKAMKEFIH